MPSCAHDSRGCAAPRRARGKGRAPGGLIPPPALLRTLSLLHVLSLLRFALGAGAVGPRGCGASQDLLRPGGLGRPGGSAHHGGPVLFFLRGCLIPRLILPQGARASWASARGLPQGAAAGLPAGVLPARRATQAAWPGAPIRAFSEGRPERAEEARCLRLGVGCCLRNIWTSGLRRRGWPMCAWWAPPAPSRAQRSRWAQGARAARIKLCDFAIY